MTSLIEGKYEVIAKIKEGGMGAIYKVRHVLLDEVRVIKAMRPQFEGDTDAKARFQQEAKMATSLRHPNIAAHLDFAEDQNHTFYLVMEFIDGVNLNEFVARGGLPAVPVTLDIALQTLGALGYLHRRGIVHRDISPDNIMLTKDADGRVSVKLIDLGVAKQTASQGMTVTGMFIGKVKYASPEQLGTLKRGEKIDGRGDVYSMGCVLYQTLTGQPAFAGESLHELMMNHLMHPPRPFDETDPAGRVPPDVREATLKALCKSRDERWTTAEEFAAALEQARDRMLSEQGQQDTQEIPTDFVRLPAPRTVAAGASGLSEAQKLLAQAFGQATTPPASAKPVTPPPLTPRPTRAPAAAVSTTATKLILGDEAAEAPTKISSAEARAAAPVSISAPVSELPTTTRSPMRRWAVAAAVVALGVAAALAVVLRRGAEAPAAAPAGAVLLKVEPWARVVSVVSEADKQAVPVEALVTPARLDLPAGRYLVTLRGEASASSGEREIVQRVEVVAGQTAVVHAVLPGFDLEQAVAANAQ